MDEIFKVDLTEDVKEDLYLEGKLLLSDREVLLSRRIFFKFQRENCYQT